MNLIKKRIMNMRIIPIVISILLFSCNHPKESENIKFPDKLIGVEIQYTYSEGNEYAVKFENDGLSYQYKSGSKPEKWWGKFEYNHIITENHEHFVSWFEPGYGDYVTLLINFENEIIYGSAIIKGKAVHFQKAKIHKIAKP